MATTIKTAISNKKPLFEEANELAQELNISRSHLFALAIEKYIANYQNQNLLDKLNQAYDDQDDPNETQRLVKMSNRQRVHLEGEW